MQGNLFAYGMAHELANLHGCLFASFCFTALLLWFCPLEPAAQDESQWVSLAMADFNPPYSYCWISDI